MVSGSDDNTIRVWDSSSCVSLATLKGHQHWVASVVFSSDGTRIVSGSCDQSVRLWDAATGALLLTFKGHMHSVESVAITRDGRHIACGGLDGVVRKWDVETGTLVQKCIGHLDGVHGVAIDPTDRRIVSCSNDKTVRIWDLASGNLLATCKASAQVWSVAVSEDFIVSGQRDGIIALWETATGQLLLSFEGHNDGVFAIGCSLDGQRIVSCGKSDNLIRVWTCDGQRIATFTGPPSAALCNTVALSPDGRSLATGHDQGIISLRNNELPPLAPSKISLVACMY